MRTAAAAMLLFVASAAFASVPSYIYARGDRVHSTNLVLSKVLKIKREFGGDFVWARIDGREYVVRDAATLAEVRKLFVPVDAISAEMDVLEDRMRPLEDREEALEEQVEKFEDGDERAPEALKEALRDVRRQLRALGVEEERLDQREEAVEQEAERQLDKVIRRAIANGIAVKR